MSKFKPPITICIFLFVALIGCKNQDLSWYEFDNIKLSVSMNDSTYSSSSSNLSFKDEALFVDIPLPDIQAISGRAKLLKHDNVHYAIGYEIDVIIDSLETKDIPEKYNKKIKIGDDIEVLPLQEVLYEVSFEFTLLDKDGFEIGKVKPKMNHNISSGKINKIKSKTDYNIQPQRALIVEDMGLDVTITKCVSCR